MSHNSSILITAETHQYLIERRDILRRKLDEGRRELASLVGGEKEELGNHPLMEAQRELDILQGQLVEVEHSLVNAMLAPVAPSNIVAVGNKVVVKTCKCGDDQAEELELIVDGVCDCGRSDVQVVTPHSPFGAAIIGARVGDECKCETPRGVLQIAIVSISRA